MFASSVYPADETWSKDYQRMGQGNSVVAKEVSMHLAWFLQKSTLLSIDCQQSSSLVQGCLQPQPVQVHPVPFVSCTIVGYCTLPTYTYMYVRDALCGVMTHVNVRVQHPFSCMLRFTGSAF